MHDVGYTCVFGDNSWKIIKVSLVVARGSKFGTLYMLHVDSMKDHVICVAKQLSLCLWHFQLKHMSISRMKCLSCLGYVLGFNFSDMSVCKNCLYGRQIILSHKGSNSCKIERL